MLIQCRDQDTIEMTGEKEEIATEETIEIVGVQDHLTTDHLVVIMR